MLPAAAALSKTHKLWWKHCEKKSVSCVSCVPWLSMWLITLHRLYTVYRLLYCTWKHTAFWPLFVLGFLYTCLILERKVLLYESDSMCLCLYLTCYAKVVPWEDFTFSLLQHILIQFISCNTNPYAHFFIHTDTIFQHFPPVNYRPYRWFRFRQQN